LCDALQTLGKQLLLGFDGHGADREQVVIHSGFPLSPCARLVVGAIADLYAYTVARSSQTLQPSGLTIGPGHSGHICSDCAGRTLGVPPAAAPRKNKPASTH
jgi:hypothetical protein